MKNVLVEIRKSFITALWFVVLTFPLIVLKVDHIDETIEWRWMNMVFMAVASFVVSYVWRYFLKRMESSRKTPDSSVVEQTERKPATQAFLSTVSELTRSKIVIGLFFGVLVFFPHVFSNYQTSIIITAMMYIILGLGLNIVVGMAGLLDLGYAAFYLIGAYTYALLSYNFDLGFWTCLPLAGIFAATLGVLLGIPVLRLRGDYLAIVTLGFHEIVRLITENWDAVTHGPSGIPNIPKPKFFGIGFGFQASTVYLYYITGLIMILAIVVIRRLHISRIGRAWLALREDETACQAMGIDTTKTKLTAFGLGAFWAGIVGVLFAAKSSFVNPASFTFFESAIILSIVVLGGMGSIRGVILATIILVLLPEYLRFFKEYRMLTFGAIMVVMMVFRPQGLISDVQHKYELAKDGLTGKKPDPGVQPSQT
ncbi:MAG: branched-chain amino acid ABC transporter permease [Proteobacteria bacterium]|nr:branched-chain amino acid ABC transporter permease [Pseudomonadota bacterium]